MSGFFRPLEECLHAHASSASKSAGVRLSHGQRIPSGNRHGRIAGHRSGQIVNVSASLVDQRLASVPAGLAALTKGGLNALTKSLAIEVAKRGVRVNAVAPGAVKTPMHAPATHDFLAKIHPVGRMG